MSRHVLLLLPLILACHQEPQLAGASQQVVRGNAERGKELVRQYGCNVCHVTPGVEGSQGMLAPSLAGVASRPAISRGMVPNTPENLVRFIQAPSSMNPASAMPPLNVTPLDAQDLAAYLATLR